MFPIHDLRGQTLGFGGRILPAMEARMVAAGLVHREKHGREHVIEFRGEPLRQVAGWVHEYERFWNEHLDRLESYFIEKRKRK